MRFKLLLVFVEDAKTEAIIDAAREAGATGCTIINHARGEGIKAHKSFFGMTLSTGAEPGTGLAVQINVEDAVGILHQAEHLTEIVGEEL